MSDKTVPLSRAKIGDLTKLADGRVVLVAEEYGHTDCNGCILSDGDSSPVSDEECGKLQRWTGSGDYQCIKKGATYKNPPSATPIPKPLIGVMPRPLYDYFQEVNRLDDLLQAMERYAKAGKSVPVKWVKELRDRHYSITAYLSGDGSLKYNPDDAALSPPGKTDD